MHSEAGAPGTAESLLYKKLAMYPWEFFIYTKGQKNFCRAAAGVILQERGFSVTCHRLGLLGKQKHLNITFVNDCKSQCSWPI